MSYPKFFNPGRLSQHEFIISVKDDQEFRVIPGALIIHTPHLEHYLAQRGANKHSFWVADNEQEIGFSLNGKCWIYVQRVKENAQTPNGGVLLEWVLQEIEPIK